MVTSAVEPVPGTGAGHRRRRRRSPEAARAEIIDAAEAVLRETPFSDLTVDLVMRRTGMTRSSFYHYFSGLEALILGVLERFEQDLVGSVEPWLSGAAQGRGGVEGTADLAASLASTEVALSRMLRVFREHAAMVSAVTQAASANPAVYQRWQTRVMGAFIERTAEFIRRQVARGLSRAGDPTRLANALIRMNSAVVQDNLSRRQPDAPETLARVLAGIWNAAIYDGGTPGGETPGGAPGRTPAGTQGGTPAA